MSKIKKSLPSLFSYINASFGLSIILIVANNSIKVSVYLLILAAILDGFDGFLARKLNSQSEYGKQLDSFADLLTFGVAPSAILWNLLIQRDIIPIPVIFIVCTFYVFTIISRLSSYNSNTEREQRFSGLPSPAGAIALCSFLLFYNDFFKNNSSYIVDVVIIVYIIFIAWLLISKISFGHVGRYLFEQYDIKKVIICTIYFTSLAIYTSIILFFSILLYTLLGVFYTLKNK